MMSKKERNSRQKGSIAKEFKRSKEDKFRPKTLEDVYWDDPNSAQATIARSLYEGKEGCIEIIEHQGIKS